MTIRGFNRAEEMTRTMNESNHNQTNTLATNGHRNDRKRLGNAGMNSLIHKSSPQIVLSDD